MRHCLRSNMLESPHLFWYDVWRASADTASASIHSNADTVMDRVTQSVYGYMLRDSTSQQTFTISITSADFLCSTDPYKCATGTPMHSAISMSMQVPNARRLAGQAHQTLNTNTVSGGSARICSVYHW